jgi:hypothetical protein
MLYFYLSLCILLLAILAVFFIRSVDGEKIPPNAQLIVDTWNSIAGKKLDDSKMNTI